MSEQLKEFGAQAETLVEIPELAELDRRGRHLRVRRRAGVAAALAVVLTVGGVAAAQIHRKSVDTGPVKPPHAHAHPYPGVTMKTLKARTYQLRPSLIDRTLVAELTVPPGWNAWIGPNRFDGHAPGRSNEQALGHLTWYVGALVLEVDEVNTHGCTPDLRVLETSDQVVRALRRAFSTEVISAPEQVRRFGHPATHLRMRVTKEIDQVHGCPGPSIFHSTTDGDVQYAYPGTVLDIWVVEVDGRPIYVQRAWTPNAPEDIRHELDGVIDSIEFKNAD